MNPRTRLWVHGLFAALIGGGSSAVTASVTTSLIAPDKFNFGPQLHNFFELAAATFIVNAFLSVMFYLKQSPLPPSVADATESPQPTPSMKTFMLILLIGLVPFMASAQTSTNVPPPEIPGSSLWDKIRLDSTNWVAIPYGGYQVEAKEWVGGICLLNKVAENFWAGFRVQDSFRTGETLTAGIQGQLQATVKVLGIPVTPGLESCVGIGKNTLFGSTGPFVLVHIYTLDFSATKHLSFGAIGNYEHYVNGDRNGNQANGGAVLNYRF